MDIAREACYKLSHYKIIEGVGGGLCWESHHGLSDCQTGRCFIEGNILIIGPVEFQRPGFLKREFMEHLDRLPTWEKTKYFCLSQSVYKCKTGERMSLIPEIEGHMDVTLSAETNRVMDKMEDNMKIPLKNFYGKKHFSALKAKIAGTREFVKQWINLIHGSR